MELDRDGPEGQRTMPGTSGPNLRTADRTRTKLRTIETIAKHGGPSWTIVIADLEPGPNRQTIGTIGTFVDLRHSGS